MRRVAALLGLLVGMVTAGPASALDVEATLDRAQAQVGEQVVLSVVVRGGIRSLPTPDAPDLGDDFDVYPGGTQQNYSLVNGRMSASKTVSYVLIPRREGTFTIGSMAVETKDETVRTKPLILTVAKGSTPPPPDDGETGSTSGSEDLFVRATVDDDTPYVYQQVTYRVRLYTRLNLLDNPGFSPPSTEGFWKEDLPLREPYIETVGGKRYRVLEVNLAVFPTAPGELTIGSSVLECNVESVRRPRDPFTSFGRGFFNGRKVVLRSDPVTLRVRALPAGAPPGFRGAVGEFALKVTADRTEVAQNEPVTLTVEVSGEGNLRTLGELELPPLPDFRTYPAESREDSTPRGSVVTGSVTQQFVLVPLSAGEKQVPGVEVVTFSPRAGTYRTLHSKPIALSVKAGGTEGVPVLGSRGDIELVGRDIRFIETELPAFSAVGGAWDRARGWLLALPLPVLAYAGAWVWERRRRIRAGDVAGSRRRGAGRHARAILKRARREGPAESPGRAAEAVRSYLADRYNYPRAGLTVEDVLPGLERDGHDAGELRGFLDRCDAARYAPEGSGGGAADWLDGAANWIERLEAGR